MRRGLKGVDASLNQRLATAQQGIEFLDRAGQQLQTLKNALATRLAASRPTGEGSAGDVEAQLQRFVSLWRERSAASGGTLDSQLAQVPPGEAMQRFGVRGLTLAALRSGEPETLYLAVAGRTQQAVAVAVDPQANDDELVRRFDRALAPHGIRTALNRDGGIEFSMRESSGLDPRDALAIKGEGRRFPTGQFALARTMTEEPILRPEQWQADNPAAVRETLRKVFDAQDVVREARLVANRSLIEQSAQLRSHASDLSAETHWAKEFTRTFADATGRSDYASLATLSSAVTGMHRDRVVALLREQAQ